jgi:hypothetical protein
MKEKIGLTGSENFTGIPSREVFPTTAQEKTFSLQDMISSRGGVPVERFLEEFVQSGSGFVQTMVYEIIDEIGQISEYSAAELIILKNKYGHQSNDNLNPRPGEPMVKTTIAFTLSSPQIIEGAQLTITFNRDNRAIGSPMTYIVSNGYWAKQ